MPVVALSTIDSAHRTSRNRHVRRVGRGHTSPGAVARMVASNWSTSTSLGRSPMAPAHTAATMPSSSSRPSFMSTTSAWTPPVAVIPSRLGVVTLIRTTSPPQLTRQAQPLRAATRLSDHALLPASVGSGTVSGRPSRGQGLVTHVVRLRDGRWGADDCLDLCCCGHRLHTPPSFRAHCRSRRRVPVSRRKGDPVGQLKSSPMLGRFLHSPFDAMVEGWRAGPN